MRLISLNIWGANVMKPLLEFIESEADSTDIFCFQEVTDIPSGLSFPKIPHNHPQIFSDLTTVLARHTGLFGPSFDGVTIDLKRVKEPYPFGLATFVKQDLKLTTYRDVFIGNTPAEPQLDAFLGNRMPRNMQIVSIKQGSKPFTIGNAHGLWIGGFGKRDAPERLAQSQRINQWLKNHPAQILCGDFNLDPDTDSLRILEEGRHNLIKDYGIGSTRTKFYEKPGKFADYTLVSDGIKVNKFEVPDLPISDHRPMILDFELV